MCLKIANLGAKSLKKKFEQQDVVTCFKVGKKLDGRFFSPYQGVEYTPGEIKSSREEKEFQYWEKSSCQIDHGIHVCLSIQDVTLFFEYLSRYACDRFDFYVLPVQCHKDDFVAEGVWGDDETTACAVFMKVTVLEEDHQKAILRPYHSI